MERLGHLATLPDVAERTRVREHSKILPQQNLRASGKVAKCPPKRSF